MNLIKHVPEIGIGICAIAIAATLGCKPIEAPRTTSALASNAEMTMLYQDEGTAIVRMESELEVCVIYERVGRDAVSISCRWKDQVQ